MATSIRHASRVVLALALTSACAGDDLDADAVTAGVVRGLAPAFVTLGGFNSCVAGERGLTPAGTERWARSAQLTQRFARGDPRWVRGCFDRASRLYWISSTAPAVVRSTTLDALAPFFAAVAEVIGREPRPVYVLGHSHGGWLAMYVAWALPPTVRLRQLVTVDPISPSHCTPASYLRALASPASTPWILEGCQRAPTDFTPDARRRIVARLPDGGWRHYYQRNFLPLRSGPFAGAPAPHRSYDVSAFLTHNGGARPAWNAHTGIDTLAVVWYTFEASIAHDLAGA